LSAPCFLFDSRLRNGDFAWHSRSDLRQVLGLKNCDAHAPCEDANRLRRFTGCPQNQIDSKPATEPGLWQCPSDLRELVLAELS